MTPFDGAGAPVTGVLRDARGRVKRKLRVSLTDRCNFRCRYCMPAQPQWLPKRELLRTDELAQLAGLLVDAGIRAIRITGGEPLLRADAAQCVAAIHALRARGLERLSMTTNGSYLAAQLPALRAAGLDDINLSLDALDPRRFAALRGGKLAPVLEGIEAARVAGVPLKLNTVLIRGQNDDQVLALVDWAMARALSLRFIEYMPLDAPGNWSREHVVDEAEVLARLATRYTVERLPRGIEPAATVLLDGHYRLGLVSTISNPFCGSCDRLRLTARGEFYTCLFASHGPALGAALRAGESPAALLHTIREAVWHKQAGYAALQRPVERPILMHALGG